MNASLLLLLEFLVIIAILGAVLVLSLAAKEPGEGRPALVLLSIGTPVFVLLAAWHFFPERFSDPEVVNLVVILVAGSVILVTVWNHRWRVVDNAQQSVVADRSNGQPSAIKVAYYDFAPVIFLALDSKGFIRTINPYGCAVMNCDEGNAIGKNWFEDFVAGSNREHSLKMFHECLETETERSFRSHVRGDGGHLRLIQWKCGLDKGTNLVLYAGEDITERESEHVQLIRSLKKLRRLKERLAERVKTRTRDLENINMDLELQIDERKVIENRLINSQRLYSAIAHNFPSGLIAVLDLNLNFLMIDGQELPLLGISADTLIGKSLFEGAHALVTESSRKHMEEVLTGRNVTFEISRNSGIYSVVAVPLYDQQDVIYAVLLVMQNITERKNVEESLYKAIEQEKKLNDLKSRFVTMASHEFRTPLTTILSSLFLMENYNGPMYEEKKHIHIDRIKRTVNMLTETLNDFLRLGRLEEGRVELILSEVCIQDHADDILREMQSVTRPGQMIYYHHHGCNLNVLLDKNLLRSIYTNLLSNAVKYSPEGSDIFLETFLSPDQLVIKVIDQGIGIAPEEQEHIFQRFFRALNAINIEGTGLGLHIIKKYVEMMGGNIKFNSGSKGTTFTASIPLQFTQDNARLILR